MRVKSRLYCLVLKFIVLSTNYLNPCNGFFCIAEKKRMKKHRCYYAAKFVDFKDSASHYFSISQVSAAVKCQEEPP